MSTTTKNPQRDLIDLDDAELDEVIGGAASPIASRNVHVIAGNGGLTWLQLLWPWTAIAG